MLAVPSGISGVSFMRFALAAYAALSCACRGGRNAPAAVPPDAAPAGPGIAAGEGCHFGRAPVAIRQLTDLIAQRAE